MKQEKLYALRWVSLNEAKVNYKVHLKTNNPKEILFNWVCKMLVTAPSVFAGLECDDIKKNIKQGRTEVTIRERYWVEFGNGEVLSITEEKMDYRGEQALPYNVFTNQIK